MPIRVAVASQPVGDNNATGSAPLSVAIIALDAARQIGPCLDSVSFAREVVVVDSGSQDATADVAKAHGARIFQQAWLGFGKQKQFAVEQASNDWVLCIDADERVSEALRKSIEEALKAPGFQAYRMARRNRFMGRWLRHGEGYPDWSLRLFNRRAARWSDDEVHERVLFDGPVGTLTGDLLHESQESMASYLAKQDRYTTLQAEALYREERRAGILQLVASPVLRFLKFYFLRLGFLDGIPGLVHISIGCRNSFVKYAKLMKLWRDERV